MRAERRTEVVFRSTGIALLALGVPRAFTLFAFLRGSLSGPEFPPAFITHLAVELLLDLLGPVVLMAFGGLLSQLLLRPRLRNYSGVSEHLLHAGVCLMALTLGAELAFRAAGFALPGYNQAFLVLAGGAASMALLLAFSWPAARFACSLVPAVAGRDTRLAARTTGLLLIGAFSVVVAFARIGMSLPGWLLAAPRQPLGYTATVGAAGMTLVAMAGRLASGMGNRCPGPEGPGPLEEAPPRTWYELVALAAITYLWIWGVGYLARAAHVRGALVSGTLLLLLLAPPAALAGRLLAPALARLLARNSSTASQNRGARPLLWLEAGISLVALHLIVTNLATFTEVALRGTTFSVSPLGGMKATISFRGWERSFVSLAAVVAAMWLVLLRGDVAWLLWGTKGVRRHASRQRRAALLCPWISFLGAWHLARFLPTLIFLIADRPNGPFPTAESIVGNLTGLTLAAALFSLAGPVSRLLSHGPILPRIWRLGWERPSGEASNL